MIRRRPQPSTSPIEDASCLIRLPTEKVGPWSGIPRAEVVKETVATQSVANRARIGPDKGKVIEHLGNSTRHPPDDE